MRAACWRCSGRGGRARGSTRFIIGAARSGSGKTTLTLAILAALRRRGMAVRGAKSGPDYIDPAFHAAATGAPGPNSTAGRCRRRCIDLAADVAARHRCGAVECAMGLFDGVAAAPGRSGAAADLARAVRLPVLLVLDVSGQSQTAAAVVRGSRRTIRASGSRGGAEPGRRARGTRQHCRAAIAALGLPVVGAVPAIGTWRCRSGTSGWCRPASTTGWALLGRLADLVERSLDLDGILAHAATWQPGADRRTHAATAGPADRPRQRCGIQLRLSHLLIGMARGRRGDRAILAACRRGTATTTATPAGCRAAIRNCMAAARRCRDRSAPACCISRKPGRCTASAAVTWCWVRRWRTQVGRRTRWSACLDHVTSFAQRRMHLGYREATLLHPCAVGAEGAVVRGHEYHYASVIDPAQTRRWRRCAMLRAARWGLPVVFGVGSAALSFTRLRRFPRSKVQCERVCQHRGTCGRVPRGAGRR